MADPQDTIPGLTNTETKPTGKRELPRDGNYQLILEASKKMDAIKRARDAERNDLLEQIEQTKVLEQADVKGSKVHPEKDVTALRETIFDRGGQLLTSMRKLPVEVLSYIFQCYVGSGQSPWSLTNICRAWTRTALGTPHLWTHLLFPATADLTKVKGHQTYGINGKMQISIDNWQVYPDIGELDAALQRSGAALPLTLKFERGPWTKHNLSQDALLRFISNPLSERVGSLDLGAFCITDPTFAADILIGTFPALKEIMVQSYTAPWLSKLLKAVASTSDDLEAASIRGDITDELASYSFWNLLKRLHIGPQPDGCRGVNWVTPKLSSLEHFEHWLPNWPNEMTPASTWPKIREITLSCLPIHLSRLRLPQLESLAYLPASNLYDEVNDLSLSECGKLSYPMLRTLELYTADPRWPQYTSGAFTTVENLTIRCGRDDGMIIAILQTMPNVRNLHLLNMTPWPDVELGLIRRFQSSEEPLVCPQLKSLRLGDPDYLVTAKGKNAPLVKSLVDFREQIGKPLGELTVHWEYPQEVTDYILSEV